MNYKSMSYKYHQLRRLKFWTLDVMNNYWAWEGAIEPTAFLKRIREEKH